jgi:sugar lactone lactonase YvrE/poly(3-hydroxybutyrate) depolymerase
MNAKISLLSLACVAFITFVSHTSAADEFPVTSDSKPQTGVPKGGVTQAVFTGSNVFPGTERDYWVYVPKQLDASKPAPVMVFQDGLQYNAPVVFDNLIARKEIPPMVGVFVRPGVVPATSSNALPRYNRSFEYDGLGDAYARFLVEELLPHVAATVHVNLSTNGNDRAIAGNSSGAIAAFTAAWERPDDFRRVFSAIGTYVNLRGGNDYPSLIRKTEPKPIRVFLQDGTNDLNIYGGSWWVANQDMLSALQFAGYDVSNSWGGGAHDIKHATAIFPEALRWLWRDYPSPVIANAAQKSKQPLMEILVPGQDWQLVSAGHRFTEGPAANTKGEVFFTDIPNNRIHKVALDGKVTGFAENTGGANGLMFGSDGRLYACANDKKQIVAYDKQGNAQTIVEGAPSNDLVVLASSGYFTDPGNKRVWFVNAALEKSVVDAGIESPNGIIVSPDQSLLYVADTRGRFVYSFQIQPDGTLAHKQRFFYLHVPDTANDSGADGMTVDTLGRLYVTTRLGVQVCDQAGRVQGIIARPQNGWLANVCFGGANYDELYATCGDKVFKRQTKVRGVQSFETPIKPPQPRL